MKAFDQAAITAGKSERFLIDAAASAIRDRIFKLSTHKQRENIAILVGPGNNGADALSLARIIGGSECSISIIIAHTPNFNSGWREQFNLINRSHCKLLYFGGEPEKSLSLIATPASEVIREISTSSILVDGLLGNGQKGAPRGAIAQLLTLVDNADLSSNAISISIDLPTGMNCDSGEVYEPHFTADITITVQALKRGVSQYPGRTICGEIEVVDIGIPVNQPVQATLVTAETAPKYPTRSQDFHKGDAGKILVIGGSKEMPGAPILSGFAALKSGAGVVHVTNFSDTTNSNFPEIILRKTAESSLNFTDLNKLLPFLDSFDAVVVGPGLGREPSTISCCSELLLELAKRKTPTVIDADALYALKEVSLSFQGNFVITPHPGEAATLLNCSADSIQQDRFNSAKELANRFNCIAVLKGAGTITADSNHFYVNTTGNPWMATAGSGDVLSGLIATLIAQKCTLVEAAQLGVFIHGLAGDIAHSECNGPIVASDIAKSIPYAIGRVR